MVIGGEKWGKIMIIGEFQNKLGAKNRLALPKKFRDQMGTKIIATRGYEDCVIVVNSNQWKNLLKIFDNKPFTTSRVRDTRRFLIGGASEIDLDKQGRFVVPKNLKSFAGIKNEVVFVGLVDWVEIWDIKSWKKRIAKIKPTAGEIAEKLYQDEVNKN